MARSLTVVFLVALQLLAALAWPAHASTVEEVQHRALHGVLAQHAHDEAQSLAGHDASHGHGHDHDLQLSASVDPGDDAGTATADHHHHDFNLSVALLLHYPESVASSHGIQNPRVLPAMHSAEQRAHLRPPQV